MLEGIASAFLVLLLFGVALGAALFRPVVPNPAPDALTVPEAGNPTGGGQDRVENTNSPPADIESMLREIEQERSRLEEERLALQEERARLGQEQVKLDERKAKLDQRQAELDEHKAELNQRQAELNEHEAKLEEWATSLQVWEERLREAEARLRTKEANLAELEQKLQGLLRWSVVAVVVSGLMAVPSVVFFVALMRQDQRVTDKRAQRDGASRGDHRERPTQHSRMATPDLVLTQGNNGRTRESVSHFPWREPSSDSP